MQVFVVLDGHDRPLGVFSTRELAEALIAKHESSSWDWQVEEHELDKDSLDA
jgi:hypothetical protein